MTPQKTSAGITRQFLVLARNSSLGLHESCENQNETLDLWHKYVGQLMLQQKFVSIHKLCSIAAATTVSSTGATQRGIVTENIACTMVIHAYNLHHAKKLAVQCPILHFGGTLEVREILLEA